MTRHPSQPAQHPAVSRVLARALRRGGRMLLGLAATVALLGLLAGVPYGLARWVGWPLPHHWPTSSQVKDTLTGPFTDRILLDTLACLCWLIWALFLADVVRAVPDTLRDPRWDAARPRPLTSGRDNGRRAGPLRGLAVALLTTIVSGLLSLRPHPTALAGRAGTTATGARPAAVGVCVAAGTPVTRPLDAATARLAAQHAAGARTVTVQPPHDGTHDSLWRIAQRCLGDGARWPEIYRLNQGLPQPDGAALTRPSLIQPGWVLRLPALPDDHTGTPVPSHPGPSAPRPPTRQTASPSAAPTTPATPTMPATTPTHGPAPSPAALSPTAPSPSRSAGRPAVHATGRGGGVDLGDGALIGLGLAGAVSAALVVTRRRRRRFYLPGSGRRDDLLPLAPVVRTLHLAHLRATNDPASPADANAADTDAEGADSEPNSDRVDLDTEIEVDADHGWVGRDRPRRRHGAGSDDGALPDVPAGVAAGQVIAVDLAGLHGLGLVGPGAADAARALLLHLLTAAPRRDSTASGPVVLVPAETAAALQLPDTGRLPARLRPLPDLATALDQAETELLRQARTAATSSTHDATGRNAGGELELVLVTSVPADTRRLQAILDTATSTGVGAILLGQWRPGTSLFVAADGSVTATSPGQGKPLRGARLFHLTAADAAEVLDLLGTAERSAAEPPATAATAHTDDPVAGGAEPARPSTEAMPSSPRPDTRASPKSVDSIPDATRLVPPEPRARSDQPHTTSDATRTVTTTRPAADHPPARDHRQDRTDGTDRPEQAAWLALTVLGPVRLTWTPPHHPPVTEVGIASDITGALSPRLRELLVLLAVHPDGITRDRLSDLLWPDTPAGRPFATLNKSLARLRRTIATATDGQVPEIVVASADRHQLDPGVVKSDFRVFSEALSARRAARSDEERAVAYRQVVSAYRGELAEGLAAEWLETSREAVRRDAVDAATGLARLLAANDPRAAVDLLETGRAFDPYNEAIYRDIMTLQRRLGQLDAIERTLALLTTRLGELEETPGSQTLALVQRLRQPAPPRPAQPTQPAR